jgi:hypothetical protein
MIQYHPAVVRTGVSPGKARPGYALRSGRARMGRNAGARESAIAARRGRYGSPETLREPGNATQPANAAGNPETHCNPVNTAANPAGTSPECPRFRVCRFSGGKPGIRPNRAHHLPRLQQVACETRTTRHRERQDDLDMPRRRLLAPQVPRVSRRRFGRSSLHLTYGAATMATWLPGVRSGRTGRSSGPR